jgi:hypothetical protein
VRQRVTLVVTTIPVCAASCAPRRLLPLGDAKAKSRTAQPAGCTGARRIT